MSLVLVQSEDFLSDLEQQFEWYVHGTKLDLPDAIELAEKFKSANAQRTHKRRYLRLAWRRYGS